MHARSLRRTPIVPISAPTFSPPSHAAFYRKIAYTFFALTAVVLIGVVWLSSVDAEVRVRVKRTPIRGETLVDVSPQPGGSSQILGRVLTLPMRKTQEFTVVGVAESAPTVPTIPVPATPTATVPVMGGQTLGSAPTTTTTVYAKGEVTIINNYSKSQTLVERTRVETSDGKLYRLDKRIVVPSGERVTVAVTADKPGANFAIEPTTFTIPGLWIDLRKLIYAESSRAFTVSTPSARSVVTPPTTSQGQIRGAVPIRTTSTTVSTGERKIVTQQNIDAAYESLTNQVIEQAKKLLLANVSDARLTGAAYFVNTTGKSTSVRPGQLTAAFTAQVDVEVIGVFYSANDMQELVRARLLERLPEGQEFLSFTEQDFVYIPESVDKEGGKARLRVITNAEHRLMSNHPALQPSAIAGKSRDEAEEQLKALDGVESVEITLKPGWIGKLPRLTDHIKVELE